MLQIFCIIQDVSKAWQLNNVSQIEPRLTLAANVTKFR